MGPFVLGWATLQKHAWKMPQCLHACNRVEISPRCLAPTLATPRPHWQSREKRKKQISETKTRRLAEPAAVSSPNFLVDGPYLWRHDQARRAVAEGLASAINSSKHHRSPQNAITFIKAEEKPQAQANSTTGLLHTASDWQLQADLGKELAFLQHIATTSLRQDIIITSETSKQLIMLELTMPWEECVEEANKRKHAKYQELVEECRDKGWKTVYEPIEVGCRGFAGRSLCKVLTQLSIRGVEKKRDIKSASEATEKTTRWLSPGQHWWSIPAHPRDVPWI